MSKRKTAIATVGAGLILGVGAVAVAVTSTDDPDTRTPAVAKVNQSKESQPREFVGFGAPRKPGTMCKNGVEATNVESLRQLVKTPIYVPTQGKPTLVFACGADPVVAYGNLEIGFESGWDGIDPAKRWASMVERFGGSTTTILGRPAYVQAVGDHGAVFSAVEFVVNGTRVAVIGDSDVPLEQVKTLASSIEAPPEAAN